MSSSTHDDNDHPFIPGVDVDAPEQPDPRWCNTCGEPRPECGVKS